MKKNNDLKEILKKLIFFKKSVDLSENIWYISSAFTKEEAEWSLKTEQNVNSKS